MMFPYIETINDIYPVIRDRDEFRVNHRDDIPITTIDYTVAFSDTFPTPDTNDEELNRLYLLRRECRGIKFHKDGRIASRPYMKFFNIGERTETLPENFSWTDYVIMDKMDGSMIDAVLIDGKVYLCTKAGPTDIAIACQKWVEENNPRILDFCHELIKGNTTPLFEWCAPNNRIVVGYDKPQLVLTGARLMNEGDYMSYSFLSDITKTYGIPMVGTWSGSPDSLQSFINEAVSRQDEEGYVIAWPDGTRAKIKNEWYCQLHSAKDIMSHEKDVWRMILDGKIDDAMGFMSEEEKDHIDNFSSQIHKAVHDLSEKIKWDVLAWRDNNGNEKKKFAVEYVNNDKVDSRLKGIYFKVFQQFEDGDYEVLPLVVKLLLDNCGTSTKLENVRSLIGLTWVPLYQMVEDGE